MHAAQSIKLLVAASVALAWMNGCGTDADPGTPEGSGDVALDVSGDAGTDAATDVTADAVADADPDALDASVDPAVDVSADVQADSSADVDAAPDADPTDVAIDADTSSDAAPDTSDGGRPPGCGDGVRGAGEECDDGNDINTDECSNQCRDAICGDGIVNSTIGVETFSSPIATNPQGTSGRVCDDGASCPSSTCDVYERGNAVEHGICQSLGFDRAITAVWGDGQGSGVSPMLHAYNWTCFDYDCTASTAANTAADCASWEMLFSLECEGVVGEGCDDGDGNGLTPDACRPDCTPARCGDGVIDTGEACDDGDRVDANGCRNDCTLPFCGDDITNGDEQCDDANLNDADGCRNDCTLPFCGDGDVTSFSVTDRIEGPEVRNPFGDVGRVCGEGASCSGSTCNVATNPTAPEHGICQALGYLRASSVTWGGGPGDADEVMPHAYNWTCTEFACGPSTNAFALDNCASSQMLAAITCVTNLAETCDLGPANSDAPDGVCRTDCRAERCGDAIVDTGEACDDGNTVANDGCSNACALPACGDGVVQGDEACDDGNDIDTDFCMNACTLPICGDGVLSVTEECDEGEGNADVPDATCRTDCTLTGCGDGVVDAAEQCDDGNENNRDECTTRCEWAACGDGYLQRDLGEACDDGNTESGDGCDAFCLREAGAGVGGVVYIGHDYFERSAATDVLVGNAVALGARGSAVNVLGWTEWADRSASGEVENVNAAIGARLSVLGIEAVFTAATTRAGVEDQLDAADVLVMYEAESGSTSGVATRGTDWSELLTTFVARGGVIVVTDFSGDLWGLLRNAGLVSITSSATIGSGTSTPLSLVAPDDPLVIDMPASYPATNGSRSVALAPDSLAIPIYVDSRGGVVVFRVE